MTESGVARPLSVAEASFWAGLLMATMHSFLGRAAEVERLDAALARAAGGGPTAARPPDLRR